MNIMIEMKELHYFVVCADVGSFGKAAEILYVTQPNVSKVIHNMEAELGYELFVRSKSGISLTSKGRHAYEYASKILEQEEKFADLRKLDSRRELSICCNPSSWIANRFTEFYRDYHEEGILYRLIEGSVNTVLKRVGSGMDEIGFVFFSNSQSSKMRYRMGKQGLVFHKLSDMSMQIYFSEVVKKNIQSITTGQEAMRYIKSRPLIQCYEDEFALNHYWENLGGHDEEDDVTAEVAVITNSDYVMSRMLEETDLCNISAGDLGSNQSHVGMPLTPGEDNVTFGYVTLREGELSETAEQFLSYLKSRIGK